MWDSKTLETIKTIPVQGRPDGILFEPATERVYVFSHSAPNATVIDAKNNQIILITTEPAPAPPAAADATARSASVTTTATPATPAAGADQPAGGRRGGRGGGGGPGLLDILVVGQ